MEDAERAKRLEDLKKQRDELDKLISELSEPVNLLKTNIPYAQKFISSLGGSAGLKGLSGYSPQELLQMKMFVNKKCNQISTDYNHTVTLVNEMLQYRENELFAQIFTHKLLEQGKVQVSSHFDSYKPLSYILLKLDSPKIVSTYLRLLVSKEGPEQELRGMYAIYFGYLNLKEDASGSWFWIASIMNCQPNSKTGYVLETFISICSEMLYEKTGYKFVKLADYIKTHFLKELSNPPLETRIEKSLEAFLDK